WPDRALRSRDALLSQPSARPRRRQVRPGSISKAAERRTAPFEPPCILDVIAHNATTKHAPQARKPYLRPNRDRRQGGQNSIPSRASGGRKSLVPTRQAASALPRRNAPAETNADRRANRQCRTQPQLTRSNIRQRTRFFLGPVISFHADPSQ